jgi:hypothetical protein
MNKLSKDQKGPKLAEIPLKGYVAHKTAQVVAVPRAANATALDPSEIALHGPYVFCSFTKSLEIHFQRLRPIFPAKGANAVSGAACNVEEFRSPYRPAFSLCTGRVKANMRRSQKT